MKTLCLIPGCLYIIQRNPQNAVTASWRVFANLVDEPLTTIANIGWRFHEGIPWMYVRCIGIIEVRDNGNRFAQYECHQIIVGNQTGYVLRGKSSASDSFLFDASVPWKPI